MVTETVKMSVVKRYVEGRGDVVGLMEERNVSAELAHARLSLHAHFNLATFLHRSITLVSVCGSGLWTFYGFCGS